MRKFRIIGNNQVSRVLDREFFSGYDSIVLSLCPRDRSELNKDYNQSELYSVLRKEIIDLNMVNYGVRLRNYDKDLYIIYDYHRDVPYGLTGLLNLLKSISICRTNNFKRILIIVYKASYARILYDIYDFLAKDNNIDIDIISLEDELKRSSIDYDSCLAIPSVVSGLELDILSEGGGRYKRIEGVSPRITVSAPGVNLPLVSFSLDDLSIVYQYIDDISNCKYDIAAAKKFITKHIEEFISHYDSNGSYTDNDLLKDLERKETIY